MSRRLLERIVSRRRGSVRRQKTPRVAVSILDVISVLLFSPLAGKFSKTFDIERVLREAGLNIHPLIYSARVVTLTIFAAIMGSLLIVSGLLFFRASLQILLIILLTGLMAPIGVLAGSLLYPLSMISFRRSSIESELPFFVTYAAFMARGNISLVKVFERFAEMPLFHGMRREARLFLRELRVFGRDPITSLESIASQSPSPDFKDLIIGYTTVLRIGGDVVSYLESRAEEMFTRTGERIKAVIERMGLIIEIYMILAVVVTLSLYVLFVSAGGLQLIGAQGGLSNMSIGLYLFLFLPLMSIMTIVVTHYSQPRQRVFLRKTLSSVYIGVVAGAVSGVLLFIATGAYRFTVGLIDKSSTIALILSVNIPLIVFSGIVWTIYRREARALRGINQRISMFLEDISEARRTGLSPERSILQAMKRDYGPLTPVVRRIGIAVSLGIDIETAVKRGLADLKNWFARVMFRFLVDSIKVGGGSPEVLYSLSRYSRALAELETRLRGSLRTYVMMPYISAIMLSVSTVMFLMMILQAPTAIQGTTQHIEPAAVYSFIALLGIGISVNSWIMGLVAGKISELSLAEGLKHGLILVVISVAVLVTMVQFYVNI